MVVESGLRRMFIEEYGEAAWEAVSVGSREIPKLDIGLFRNPSERKKLLTQRSNTQYNEDAREVTENA